MNAESPVHPTDHLLCSYGLGKLDDSSASAVSQHLERCAECRQRVGEISSDSFLGRLQEARGAGSPAMEGASLLEGTLSFVAGRGASVAASGGGLVAGRPGRES